MAKKNKKSLIRQSKVTKVPHWNLVRRHTMHPMVHVVWPAELNPLWENYVLISNIENSIVYNGFTGMGLHEAHYLVPRFTVPQTWMAELQNLCNTFIRKGGSL